MRLCAEFPTIEMGNDVGGIRAFAQAVQDMGFADLLVYDHVLGASAAYYDSTKLSGSYREHSVFHEAFVLFGFVAGIAPKLGFATNVMVLPQRQTVLAAKQAAQVDLLCGGRLRLGVGIGWNYVEYEGLGVPFKERAARQEEQIALMRELWTKPIVNFQGKFHRVTEAGINPMPVQRPIPIWLGGMVEPVLKRVGALADGWFPNFPTLGGMKTRASPTTEEDPAAIVERMRGYARAAGRDPAKIGINCDLWYANATPEVWSRNLEVFRKLGATHVTINTLGSGLKGADAHIAALRRVREAI
jgi:probable F420-dependent oxidoreductase